MGTLAWLGRCRKRGVYMRTDQAGEDIQGSKAHQEHSMLLPEWSLREPSLLRRQEVPVPGRIHGHRERASRATRSNVSCQPSFGEGVSVTASHSHVLRQHCILSC